MTGGANPQITEWLHHLAAGKTNALNQLLPSIYEELRVLARSRLRHERPGHTLSTTGLVNEAYLKLNQQHRIKTENRAEFFAFASECMRRVLVDYARAHRAGKRNDGEKPIALQQVEEMFTPKQAQELMDIDIALDKLADQFPRGVKVLQYRLFAGLTLEETALALEVSSKTVQRDWQLAIAWLRKEVGSITVAVAGHA